MIIIYNLSLNEWTILGVIVNIILAILTFSAVMVSVWTVRINSYPKGKIYFQKDNDEISTKYRLKLVNKRVVPITVIEKGIYAKEKDEIFKENINNKIGFSDLLKFEVLTSDLNQELLKKGYNEGDNLKIYGFFKCASGKIYKKRITHIVTEFEMQ